MYMNQRSRLSAVRKSDNCVDTFKDLNLFIQFCDTQKTATANSNNQSKQQKMMEKKKKRATNKLNEKHSKIVDRKAQSSGSR